MTEYGTIWADQNQKNGDISVPDGRKLLSVFFYRILRQKIRLKKLAKKKFDLRPRSFLMSKVKIPGLTMCTY